MKRWPFFVAVVLWLATSAVACWALRPPAPLPLDAPVVAFSAARATQVLEAIARTPRSVGSPAHAEARAHLVERLRALGLEVWEQPALAVRHEGPGRQVAASVTNIVARIKGAASTGAVMLVGHYDSVPTSPGVCDDGTAVASMVETARALKASEALKNDVVLLFTDAEEVGLLGAEAFVREPPFALPAETVLLNFEARGTSGPTFMFETSPGNAWLVEELAAAGVRPVSTSLASEVYRQLPNDTDFTVLKHVASGGLNFGYIEEYFGYHTAHDDLAHLDARTLQHQGEVMLAVTRRLGNAALSKERLVGGPDAQFFSVGPLVMTAPMALAWPLLALAFVAWVVALVRAVRRDGVRVGRVLAAAVLHVVVAVLGAAVVTGAWELVLLLRPEVLAMPQGEPHERGAFAVAMVAVTLAVTLGAWRLLVRWWRPLELGAGALAAWMLVGAVVTVLVPGASYAFVVPALAGVGAFWATGESMTPARVLALVLLPVPVLVVSAPLVEALSVALTLSAVGVSALQVGLVAWPLAVPVLWLERGGLVGRVAVVAGVVGLLALGVGVATFGFDAERARPDSVGYLWDADRREGLWATSDELLDARLSPVFAAAEGREWQVEYFPTFHRPVRVAKGPAVEVPAPVVEVMRDEVDGGVRTVAVRAASTRGAPVVEVQVEPAAVLLGARFFGREVTAAALQPRRNKDSVFQTWAVPDGGVVLEVVAPADAGLKFRVVDLSFDLPPAAPLPSRGEDVESAPFGFVVEEGTRSTRELKVPPAS